MGGKISRNAPDNEDLPSPSFIMSPGLVKKTCIQCDPGGNQCCSGGILTKDPHPYPLVYVKGRGLGWAPTLRTRKDIKTTTETNINTKWGSNQLDCVKCGKYLRGMNVNQPLILSPASWGGWRGMLRPDQLLILVTQLKKEWMSIKSIPCQWRKLNRLKIQKKSVNSIGSVEISITTWAEEADVATKLEYFASDIENCTVEKVAVVAKGEAAKVFKVGTDTGMKKYLRCNKCRQCIFLIPAHLNQFAGGHQGPRRGLMRRERRSAAKEPIKILRNQWMQSELLRFVFPLHLKKLMRLPNCPNFQ